MDGLETRNTKGAGNPAKKLTAQLPPWPRQDVCRSQGHLNARDKQELGSDGQIIQTCLCLEAGKKLEPDIG